MIEWPKLSWHYNKKVALRSCWFAGSASHQWAFLFLLGAYSYTANNLLSPSQVATNGLSSTGPMLWFLSMSTAMHAAIIRSFFISSSGEGTTFFLHCHFLSSSFIHSHTSWSHVLGFKPDQLGLYLPSTTFASPCSPWFCSLSCPWSHWNWLTLSRACLTSMTSP